MGSFFHELFSVLNVLLIIIGYFKKKKMSRLVLLTLECLGNIAHSFEESLQVHFDVFLLKKM